MEISWTLFMHFKWVPICLMLHLRLLHFYLILNIVLHHHSHYYLWCSWSHIMHSSAFSFYLQKYKCKEAVDYIALSMPWNHTRGVEEWLHSFLTSALDGGTWLTSHPGLPRRRNPGTLRIGWVGSRIGLDVLEIKILWIYRDSNPGPFSP